MKSYTLSPCFFSRLICKDIIKPIVDVNFDICVLILSS